MRLLLSSRSATVAAALALAAAGLVPQFLSRTLPDVAFLLYAAGRVLDGSRLYVDLIEINPPLVVWFNVPVVLAARAAGMSEILAYRLAVTLVLGASVLGCRAVLQRMRGPDESPLFRRGLLLLIVFALFVLPRLDWGEREHLTLALALPYLLLGAVRLEGSRVPRGMAVVAGLAAAAGIALKPQMTLLWLAREGVVAWRRRAGPTLEGVLVAGAGLAYVAAVLVVTPEYLPLVRELGPAYHTYLHDSMMITALLGDGAALVLGALIITGALWNRGGSRSLRVVLAAGTVACYLAAVVQQKGWRYHFYPALSLAWILLAITAAGLRRRMPIERLVTRRPDRWTGRIFGAIAGATVATVALAALGGALVQAVRPLDPRYDADPSIGLLVPMLREYASGEPVLVLSPNMASGFPLTTYAGTEWPQRFSNLWPLVAAYDGPLRAAAPLRIRTMDEASPLETRIRAAVTEDFLRSRPPIVLVLATGPDEPKWGMRRLDLLEFLRRDPRFGEAFAGYRPAGVLGQYRVYLRADRSAGFRLPPEPGRAGAVSRAPGEVAVRPDALAVAVLFLIALAALYARPGTRPAG